MKTLLSIFRAVYLTIWISVSVAVSVWIISETKFLLLGILAFSFLISPLLNK